MLTPFNILGIDIGSVAVSVAEITSDKKIKKTAYEFHYGNITKTIRNMLNSFHLPGICGIASTASTPSLLLVNQRYDNRIAVIAAARHFHPQADKIGTILIVGGEKFGAIFFDAEGN